MERAETRELRLAVVLYGGVSLAIYMHGTTKELHRLVKASALEDHGLDVDGTPSERVYRELLRDTAERNEGVRTRVVVDVIAGTSAGGLNGVYLAKALAHNRSQESLRDLWLNRGDIKRLLRGPGWLPLLLKVPWLLATARKKPPLKGDDMSRWIYGALRDMDGGGSEPADLQTLMPPGHLLELFVTTTDFYGYDRDLIIGDPKLIHDHSHRHVLAFRYGDGDDHFSKAFNAALAFSARATSCFPGAFPPVSLELFGSYLKDDGADLSSIEPFFRLYKLSHAEPGQTYFVDGGVLDNRPFGHAIRALKRKPAESEVDRRLLYLEPHPAEPGPRPPGEIAEPAAHDPRHDLGHPEEGADPRRDPRRLAPQRARPAHPRHHRDDVRSDRRAGRENRRRRLRPARRQHVGRGDRPLARPHQRGGAGLCRASRTRRTSAAR